MPLRQSTVPNLDLSSLSLHSNPKISSPLTPGAQSSDGPSPLTPRSPKSSSSSPFTRGTTIRPVTHDLSSKSTSPIYPVSPATAAEPRTPGLTAIPQYPPSPKDSPKHTPSRSSFSNLKAPKPAHRTQRSDSSGNSGNSGRNIESRGSSRDRRTQISSKRSESTPDLLGLFAQAEEGNGAELSEKTTEQPELKKVGTDSDSAAVKKPKPRFANLLARSRSIRLDETSGNRSISRRMSGNLMKFEPTSRREGDDRPKTPLARPDRKASVNPPAGNNAAERPTESSAGGTLRKERSHGGSMVPSGSLSQVSGASAAFLSNIKHSSTGAADRIGKAGKGFFGKIARSGSTNERELVNDDNYVCSVINLPVMEQSRRTRVAKRLGDSRDKTEFWMPALPYRCVDYLNFRGCEEEGLYRVPGSGKEVKYWQRRFDTELDVDLFEEPDLYDINTVGSLFKAWLRELPDELFPKETQAMISEKCEGATTAPQLLKDELSKLPPYHYYLLFAITCHLNLLHTYVDQNKMDYRNLCICFQPCMKIDAFCFYFLVCDWKNCWQGCWTEKEFAELEREADEREKAAASKAETKAETDSESLKAPAADERAVSSSGSSRHDEEAPVKSEKSKPEPKPEPKSEKSKPEAKSETKSETKSDAKSETSKSSKSKPAKIDTSHSRSVSQLPELGPPLSPIQI